VAFGGGGYDGGDREAVEEEPNPIRELLPPGQLECHIGQVIGYYNTRKCQESLNNLTPENVCL
jgi:hypothetical protein